MTQKEAERKGSASECDTLTGSLLHASQFSVNMTTSFTVNAVESPEEQRAEVKGRSAFLAQFTYR